MLPEPSNNLIEQPPRHSHDEPYVVLPDAHSNNDLCDASLSPVNLPTHSSHVDPNLAHTETDACQSYPPMTLTNNKCDDDSNG